MTAAAGGKSEALVPNDVTTVYIYEVLVCTFTFI